MESNTGRKWINFGKNALAFLLGAIPGAVIGVRLGLHYWLPAQIEKMDNFAQMLFVGMLDAYFAVILFGLLGIVLGGVVGIIVYQVGRKLIGKRKQLDLIG
jgi:hypothetical protein